MSGIALIWAANVKGLKPAAKIVLIQLADFHNKETGQCNPSAQRLADECEMGRATIFRHMTALETSGLITRHARGDGDGGRSSNQYELHLDITLGASSRRNVKVASGGRVESQNETGRKVSKYGGKGLSVGTGVVPNRDTNLTIEPVIEPLSRKRETEVGLFIEKILAAYPPDRLRNKAACLKYIEEVLTSGVLPSDLLQAVTIYATKCVGYTRSTVCFSDNWFKSQRWLEYIKDIHFEATKARDKVADHDVKLISWICNCDSMCQHITANQIADLLASKRVTEAQLQAAGLAK